MKEQLREAASWPLSSEREQSQVEVSEKEMEPSYET